MYSYSKTISAYSLRRKSERLTHIRMTGYTLRYGQSCETPGFFSAGHVERKRAEGFCLTRGSQLDYLTCPGHHIACHDTSSSQTALQELGWFFIWKFALHSQSKGRSRVGNSQKGKVEISFDWLSAIYSFLIRSRHRRFLKCTHIF